MKSLKKDLLDVKIYETRSEMGKAAAADIKACLLSLLAKKETVNMIFAAAPSQNDVLKELVSDKDIKWEKVNAFHMDEYIGLEKCAPQRFSNFLTEKIFSKVNFKSVNLIDATSKNVEEEISRYSKLLKEFPPHIVVLGIGENGHIAFNDPGFADFNDKKLVKEVTLDEKCRQQQVNDGCFDCLDKVPKTALTLTVPALVSAKYLFCVVPTTLKAQAVYDTVCGEVTENCPASILRTKDGAILYLDSESAKLL